MMKISFESYKKIKMDLKKTAFASSSSSSSKLSQFFFWSCDLRIGFLIFFIFGSNSNY